MIVRMWDAQSRRDRLADLLSWLCEKALPEVEVLPLHISSEVYASTEDRLVVISKWRSDPVALPDPPGRLVARPPRSWDFAQVDR